MILDVVKVKFAIVLFECWANKELGYKFAPLRSLVFDLKALDV